MLSLHYEITVVTTSKFNSQLICKGLIIISSQHSCLISHSDTDVSINATSLDNSVVVVFLNLYFFQVKLVIWFAHLFGDLLLLN